VKVSLEVFLREGNLGDLRERRFALKYAHPSVVGDTESPAVPNVTLPSGARIDFANGRLYGVGATARPDRRV